MKIGLSLGGGGARGYAHIGAIKALDEAKINVDLINGTSIGAIVGGAYALYTNTEKLVTLVEEVAHSVNVNYFNIFRYSSESRSFLRDWFISAACDLASLRHSIFSNKNNQKALEIIFGDYRFSDTKIPFSSVTFDLIAGKTVIINEGKLADGILPSISIPGIFPPVEEDEQLLVDGYVLANIPVVELREQGADFIIAINLAMDAEEGYQNGFDLMNNVELLKQQQLDQWEMDEANFAVTINLPGFDSMRFDNHEVAIAHGYEIVKKTLPRLKRRLSKINV